MEPEPTQQVPQEAPRKAGNPNIGDIAREWRKKNAIAGSHLGVMNWEKSCMFYVKPFLEKAGWRPGEYGRKLIGILQLTAAKNEDAAKVVAEWNKMQKRTRTFVIDICVDRAGVNRTEFAELLLKTVRAHFRRLAQARVEVELVEIVDASLKFSGSTAKEASTERQRHLETQGIIDKARPSTSISVKQIANGRPAKSFDAAMDELDDYIDGEVLGETKLIGDGR